MRRNFRKRQNDKIIMFSVGGFLVLLTVVFALLMYGNSLNKEVRDSKLSSEQIASIVNNETDTESASSSIGRTIEEEERKTKEDEEQNLVTNTTNSAVTTNLIKEEKKVVTSSTENKIKNTVSSKKETKKEIKFQMPVKGEIIHEYAKENLIYSNTLQEWTTHTGIDIKAEKATVVQAAEAGKVKSIKNDPRYGLTIVIEHDNGFQTVYANLLSTEFVKEGEKVKKGQSIGTVGNTAAFESTDEPHLHFEILKDSIQVDPSIYVK